MYNEHQSEIQRYALQSPAHLYRVGQFVQLTINQHFERMPALMTLVDQYGIDAACLMPHQRRSLQALAQEADTLYAYASILAATELAPVRIAARAITHLVTLPNFGIVKAGFWAQLVLGVGGCLDRHNLRRAGLHERAFASPTSAEALRVRIHTYVATCEILGGSAHLWDTWCTGMALTRPVFASAEEVSAIHAACICLR